MHKDVDFIPLNIAILTLSDSRTFDNDTSGQALVDSLQVVADSLTRILADLEAAGDTLGVDTIAPELERIRGIMEPPEPEELPEEAAEAVPAEPPPILPKQDLSCQYSDSLAYLVRTTTSEHL